MREPIRIPSPQDDDVQIPFFIPIEGRAEPLEFTVPKFGFLPFDLSCKFDEWMLDRTRATEAGTEESKRFKTYDGVMFLLGHLLPAEVYAEVEHFTLDQRSFIEETWAAESKTSPGKSVRSSVS